MADYRELSFKVNGVETKNEFDLEEEYEDETFYDNPKDALFNKLEKERER